MSDDHEKVKAWEPFVRRAFELMDDPDGGKDLEEYLVSALKIPAKLRPSPFEAEEPELVLLIPLPAKREEPPVPPDGWLRGMIDQTRAQGSKGDGHG